MAMTEYLEAGTYNIKTKTKEEHVKLPQVGD